MKTSQLASLVLLTLSVGSLSSCFVIKKAEGVRAPAVALPQAGEEQDSAATYEIIQAFETREKTVSGAAEVGALETSFLLGSPRSSARPLFAAGTAGMLEVHFLEVGQGDSTVIRCPGKGGEVIVIDAGGSRRNGPPPPFFEDQAANEAITAIVGQGKAVKALFITHPDADHYNGVASLLAGIEVERIFMIGEKLEKKAEEKVERLKPYSYGTRSHDWLTERWDSIEWLTEENQFSTEPHPDVQCGDAEFYVLASNVKASSGSKSRVRNTRSIVIALSYGEADFVFAADATADTENALLDFLEEKGKAKLLDAEVLKLGHHGSKSSNTDRWLDAVNPTVAMVSAMPGHRYNHPHSDVIKRLKTRTALAKYHRFAHYQFEGDDDSGSDDGDGAYEAGPLEGGAVETTEDEKFDRAIFNVGEIGTSKIETDGQTLTLTYTTSIPPSDDDPVRVQELKKAKYKCRHWCKISKGAKPCTWSGCHHNCGDQSRVPDKHLLQHCTEANAPTGE